MPSLYLPHGGGPAFFMEGPMHNLFKPMQNFLVTVPKLLPFKPTAIVVISAHWECEIPTITGGAAPQLIYDYHNFPNETYALSYPACGAPDLAAQISQLLDKAGLENKVDEQRGFDHGVFIPLKVIFPNADIPVIAMSISKDMDPNKHSLIGEALAPLREEGVLIIGSGMSYHNMRPIPEAQSASNAFDSWLSDVLSGNVSERREKLNQWSAAPSARLAHPREEHLIPLMVTSGSGSDLPARKIWQDTVDLARVSAWAFD